MDMFLNTVPKQVLDVVNLANKGNSGTKSPMPLRT